MAIYLNNFLSWTRAREIYVNNGGAWQSCREIYVNNGGTWQTTFLRGIDKGILVSGNEGLIYGYGEFFIGSFADRFILHSTTGAYVADLFYNGQASGVVLDILNIGFTPTADYVEYLNIAGWGTLTGIGASSFTGSSASGGNGHWFWVTSNPFGSVGSQYTINLSV